MPVFVTVTGLSLGRVDAYTDDTRGGGCHGADAGIGGCAGGMTWPGLPFSHVRSVDISTHVSKMMSMPKPHDRLGSPTQPPGLR